MKHLQNTWKDGWKKGSDPFSFLLNGENETRAFAKEFALTLTPGSIVLLEGDLGSGKTTFVKGVAEGLGLVDYEVSSPTFVYLNLYGPLAHFDLYRLKEVRDFLLKGFVEYFEEPYIACVEWPDKIKNLIPRGSFIISLKHHEGAREISVRRN